MFHYSKGVTQARAIPNVKSKCKEKVFLLKPCLT